MARSRFRLPAWARRFKAPKTVLGRALLALGIVAAIAALALAIWVIHLDRVVTRQFEGRRWSVPARVYAQPLELYAGAPVRAEDLEEELKRLHYRVGDPAAGPGLYRRSGAAFDVHARRMRFVDEARAPVRVRIRTDAGGIAALAAYRGGELPLFRLDPPLIGSISPVHGEDRLVLAPDEVPKLLLDGLKLVEDRRFDRHRGVDPRGIARAMWANLRAGRVAQGGSTLTQQLIKSYFLTEEQTLGRKLTEAVMALRLEARFTKQEILNAYVNEVFLGQDGNRAVHGFGLGAQFWFGKPLDELDVAETATLVGIIKGPGYYDPRRRPERAKARRDLVLGIFADGGLITPETAARARRQPLGISKPGGAYVPGYLDLVRRHLKRDYAEADLAAAGLQIHTSLDPRAQVLAERALARQLKRLDASGKRKGVLEGAVVIAEPDSGDVIAVVGGRNAGFDGFNRALDAKRPIGSLVKPAVYLAALETGRYNAATILDDAPIELKLPDGKRWAPQNYTRQAYGPVPMVYALSESLNLATVRLGLDVGLPKVIDTLVKLGMGRKPAANPALLLGALDMAPLEVAQLYVPLANGGFKTRLRTVRAVVDEKGTPLKRFPVQVEAVSNPATIHQLDRMLTQVLVRGTAAGARLPDGIVAAGKTGTSNDTRDSWFAGFTGTHLAVVWVGYDDNRTTGLTGGSGALPIWSEVMAGVRSTSWEPSLPDGLDERWIEYSTGLETTPECSLDAVLLAFAPGVALPSRPGCAGLGAPEAAQPGSPPSGIVERVKGLLDKVTR
jgi:penicillin-binding protein 1B